jgi:hypothetical protein
VATNMTLSKEDRAALEHEERLREAREHKHVADRIAADLNYRQQCRKRLDIDVAECETALRAFKLAAKALAGLSEDCLARCGCGSRHTGLGMIIAPANMLRPSLDASVAAATERLSRLRDEMNTLPPPTEAG